MKRKRCHQITSLVINSIMMWSLFQRIYISFYAPAQMTFFSLASFDCILFSVVSVAVCSVSHHLIYSRVSFGPDPKAKSLLIFIFSEQLILSQRISGNKCYKIHFETWENGSVYIQMFLSILLIWTTFRRVSRQHKSHVMWQLLC